MKAWGCWFLLLGFSLCGAMAAETGGRPNILWITAEDMSPTLGCHGDPLANSPNLDRFASQGVRYTRAFASAPVCSPSRSCLITGLYATSLGTQRLRSRFPVPASILPFPHYLRKAGYFCSNNVKTDYNLAHEEEFIRKAWDRNGTDAHWRQRAPGQPFFSVFNLMTTHQSRTSVWPWDQFEKEVASKLEADERHDPDKMVVPPYYPDTPMVRRTLARYYDCVTVMDREVGGLLRQLEEDGLTESTIVFFYSDHGSGLPRHKRLLHDSGMQVAMLVRFPESHREWAPAGSGEATDRLVSFVDYAPTVLSLAGVSIPDYMEGTPFLGPAAGKPRRYVYGARDRVDEAYDLSRSVRNGRWLYIRNYHPHLSWNQPEGYSDQAEMRREVTRLAKAGELNGAQMGYAGPTKPIEELYDSEADPHQIRNLAGNPARRGRLWKMRRQLRKWILGTGDLGFLAEDEVMERSGGVPPSDLRFQREDYPLERILEVAEAVGDRNAISEQIQWMRDGDAAVRYWAAIGLKAAGGQGVVTREALLNALNDRSAPVRIEAAGALAGLGMADRSLPVLVTELRSERYERSVHAARTLELLGERARPVMAAMREKLQDVSEGSGGDGALYVRFALEEALKQLEGGR